MFWIIQFRKFFVLVKWRMWMDLQFGWLRVQQWRLRTSEVFVENSHFHCRVQNIPLKSKSKKYYEEYWKNERFSLDEVDLRVSVKSGNCPNKIESPKKYINKWNIKCKWSFLMDKSSKSELGIFTNEKHWVPSCLKTTTILGHPKIVPDVVRFINRATMRSTTFCHV